MAVKARDDVTVATLNDVTMVLPYYLTQSNTASAPVTPTTNPPTGGWTNAEPTYNSSNTVYMSFLTVFSDGSFDWSIPSKSSNYEAAKEAYNKATSATQAATSAQTAANNAQTAADMAGRNAKNFLKNGDFVNGTEKWHDYGTFELYPSDEIHGNVAHVTKAPAGGNSVLAPISLTDALGVSEKTRVLKLEFDYYVNSLTVASGAYKFGFTSYFTNSGWQEMLANLSDAEPGKWLHYSTFRTVPAGGRLKSLFLLNRGQTEGDEVDYFVDNISVTDVTEVKAAQDTADTAQTIASAAQTTADNAANDLTTFRTSTESRLTSVNGLVSGVRTDVDAVTNKANTLSSGLDSANTNITSTSDKLSGLTTTVSNVSKTADDAMALSTTNHQDLAGFKTTVQQTYSTKEDTLNQVTTVNQKADALSATLSKDYQKTADSDAKYSTKAELTATSNSITASVAETYATKSVVDALKNIADNAIETWQGHGIPSMTGKPASDWTTDVLKKQHSGDMYYDLDSGYSYRFGSEDGTAYEWSKIADSDITKAMQAAADAQSAADKANAGVSKLNTDIPVTYATKSDVKITTDGIKADVVEAKRIGQTGVDNAAALSIRADGIDATLSQQATNIDKNVKSITQLGLRADGISTSVSQVEAKADLALANAQELVINGGFETGDASKWGINATYQIVDDMSGSHSGRYYLNAGKATEISQPIAVPVIPGHTYRFSGWYRRPSTNSSVVGGIRFQKSSDGTTYYDWSNTDFGRSEQDDWTYFSIDGTIPSDGSVKYARYRLAFSSTTGVVQHFDDLSFKDITEAAAALSQVSTLSQDLSGFKTQVTQTYETKEASSSKATTAQQNLDGFKNTISATYATKDEVSSLDSAASLSYKIENAHGVSYAWRRLGTLTQSSQGQMTKVEIIVSDGNNAQSKQNRSATLYIQRGWTGGGYDALYGTSVLNHNWADVKILVLMSEADTNSVEIWVKTGNPYFAGNYTVSGFRQKWVDQPLYTVDDPTGDMHSQPVGYYESPEQAKQALANTVAATYTTKSEFTQTTDKLQSSVTASLNRMGGNMLINGGFETGDMTGWGPIDVAKTDLAGAQHSGKNRLWFQYLTQNSSKIRSNNYLSFINGHKYRLSFWVSMMDSVTFNACIWSTTKGGVKAEVTPVGSSGGKYVQITNEFDWTIEDVHDGYVVLEFPILTTADTQNGVRLDDFELTDVTDYSELSSLVTQTSEQWGVQLNQVATASTDAITDVKTTISNQSDALGAVSDKVDDEISQRQAYMQFTQDENGKPSLELGASENTNKVTLSNDRLSFMSENSEVAYISNKELHINNATIVQSLIIGNIGFIPRADGHLTLTRI